MNDRKDEFLEQLRSVRPATRNLITSILLDAWPNHTAVVDFGIDNKRHYEALYYPIREAEIMPKDLDAALGDGQKLTAMTKAASSNPHKYVEFQTSWDLILGRHSGGSTTKEALNEGALEAANALFNGNAFVRYGCGQHAPMPETEQQQEQGTERPQNDGIER